ncbi:MAG TPA: PQQ-binding-like beta-propeller repeat protein, partial [Planctomycetota bacterium]|nr:PQQ-binding-like beta-propeller repeat protein [Planctomycetota bacterium]
LEAAGDARGLLGTLPARGDESAPPYSVRDTNGARQTLEEARRALAAGDARRGVDALQRMLDLYRDDLIRLPAETPEVPPRYLPAPEVARREILALGPDGREAYEQLSGPAARALLDRATASRDEAGLAEVLSRYGGTAAGVVAGRRLAESAFERGAPRDAAAALRDALVWAPGDVGLWLRLVDALEAAGDARGLLGLAPPPESARSRTAEGDVDPAVRLEEARARVGPPGDAPSGSGWDGGADHDWRPPWDHVLRPLRWAAGEAPRARRNDDASGIGWGVQPESLSVFGDRRALAAPYFPTVVGRRLVASDGFRLTAHDLLSGRVEWRFPTSGTDLKGLDPVRRGDDDAVLAGRTNVEVAYAPSEEGGLVYATIEVVDPTYVARGLQQIEISTYRPRRVLVAVDAATGALRWRMGEHRADRPVLGRMSFASPPVVADGLVVGTGVVFDKRWQASVLAFDARTGRLRWRRDLVTSQQELNLFGEPVKELWAGAPAISDGVVYAPTGLGVLAALDLRSGAVRWLSSYATGEIERVELWYATPLRLPTWGPAPFVVHGDALLASPPDSPFLLCLDRADGKLRWRERSQATRDTVWTDHFLGVANDGQRDVAVVTGRDVRALDMRTGQFVWGTRLSGRGFVRGRGAVSRTRVYVPTTAGLEMCSLQNEGRLVPPGLLPWPQGAQPGNILLTREVLIVSGGYSGASADGVDRPVQAFFDPEDIERRIAARRRGEPTDPVPALEAADLWRLVGQDVRAEALYEEAARLATEAGAKEVAESAREGTYLLWRDRGDAAGSADRGSEARSAYEAALARAARPAERVAVRLRLDRLLRARGLETARARNLEALATEAEGERARVPDWEGEVLVRPAARFLLAKVHHAAGRPADAVDALQAVLREDGRAVLGLEPAAARATRAIGELVREAGPGVYRRHEEEAAARLAKAAVGSDPAPFEAILALYPNSEAVREAMLGLADRQAAAGSIQAATTTLRRFLTSYPDHPGAPRALADLSRAFAASGSLESARAAIGALARRYPDAKIEVDGRTLTGREFAAAERARLGEPVAPPPQGRLAARPEDRWTEPLDATMGGARCVEVLGAERAGGRLPLLVDAGGELVAVDPVAARARWRKPWERVGQAAFVGEVLVLGMRDLVVAVDPKTGEERWRRDVPGDVHDIATALGQVVVLVRTPNAVSFTRLIAIDPVTSVVAWDRDLAGAPPERIVAGDEGIAVLRPLVTTAGPMALGLTVHSALTGEAVGEVPAPADRNTEGSPVVVEGGTILYVAREELGEALVAVDLAAARVRWKRPLERERGYPRRHVFVRGGRVLVVDIVGRIRTFDVGSGDPVHETAVTGGLPFVSDRCAVLAGDRLVALTGRSRESQTLAAFDLMTGRTVWSVGVKQVGQGLLLSAGDAVVAILSPLVPTFTGRNQVNQPPEYQILRVDAAEGADVVRITPRGLGAYPPSAVIQDGALLIAGQRAWALYR